MDLEKTTLVKPRRDFVNAPVRLDRYPTQQEFERNLAAISV
jgi:hypothetical protein